MLEPWTPPSVGPSAFRALAVRAGFDLEPLLPDPAPAYVDPDGALHPALVEPLAALPLHAYPTAAARSALVARVLSEPGRPRLDDPDDPWVALYRFAARRDMEPEITGCLALVLLRERIAEARRNHQPSLPDAARSLVDPTVDVFRGRRARLRDTPWQGLRDEVAAAVKFLGSDEQLEFERTTLVAGAEWLADYEAWWRVASRLGAIERLPEDLRELRSAVGTIRPDLATAIRQGTDAEAAFIGETGATPPDVGVSARWLLGQQVRSLRDLARFTRERSLRLHSLLRRCDVARVRVQIGYRAELLRLWMAEDPEPLEETLLAIPDPPHRTTLGASLGRVIGMILLRRLRRGDDTDALGLAERALELAPEELAVRLTWNDLAYHRRGPSPVLLRSLRAERDRWDSVSVCAMGSRIAEQLGEHSVARHFRADLAERSIAAGSRAGWALAALETLADPGRRADREKVAAVVEAHRTWDEPRDPLSFILFGQEPPEEPIGDLELGLVQALDDLDTSGHLEASPVTARGGRTPAWRQLLDKKLVSSDHEAFAGRLFARLSALRSATPALRTPSVAAPLRVVQASLASAAEHGVAAPASLGGTLGSIRAFLVEPTPASEAALAAFLLDAIDPLRLALREPRLASLRRELAVMAAHARAGAHPERLEALLRLRARLEDPREDLDELDESLARLGASDAPAEGVEAAPESMRVHPDFDSFSMEELSIRPQALRRAHSLVRRFNLSGGRRDRKRLRTGGKLFELRHRSSRDGGLRVFYRRDGAGWLALAAMSKFDDRQQQDAIERVLRRFL